MPLANTMKGKLMNRPTYGILMTLALALIAGCSGSQKIESDLGIAGAPDWVNEGTQAVDSDKGRFIYGVASAPALGDEALQISAAENRARAEVARVVSTYVDATISDYSASAGDEADLSIEQSINSVTQSVLNGSKVKGRWRDENSGNIWAFVEMDMKSLDNAISTAGKLSQGFKDYYRGHSGTNFDRFVQDSR